jgi:hypothetical protein
MKPDLLERWLGKNLPSPQVAFLKVQMTLAWMVHPYYFRRELNTRHVSQFVTDYGKEEEGRG